MDLRDTSIHGTQAEYVRVPYAETSVHVLPETVTNDEAIFLADILAYGIRDRRAERGASARATRW